MTDYSKKKVVKAYEIVKMMIDDPQISIDDMRKALDVTDRTIARYISDLKVLKIIDRVGPDKGGSWKGMIRWQND
jgi:predicted HTH transcriptional regulator